MKHLYRKAALEKLSTPERLDELIQVVDRRAWVAVSALVVLFVSLVGWSVFGTLKTRVGGKGIILGGNVYDVVPLAAGQVTNIYVEIGDTIKPGQVIATVAQPDLMQQINEARAKLRELELLDQKIKTFEAKDSEMQLSLFQKQRANIQQSISFLERNLESLNKQLQVENELLNKGLITRPQVTATQQSITSTTDQIERAKIELEELDKQSLGATYSFDQQKLSSEQQINETRRLITRLEEQHRSLSEVRSPYGGYVIDLLAERGAVVSAGTPILIINSRDGGGKRLSTVLFLPAKDGKKVKKGMEVLVSPSTVRPEEYGYMLGKITRVGDYPETFQGMLRILKNEQLVNQLMQEGAPIEAVVTFQSDSATFSGFKWTSGDGPGVQIFSGTPCEAQITIENQEPITVLFPGLKRITPH